MANILRPRYSMGQSAEFLLLKENKFFKTVGNIQGLGSINGGVAS